MQPAPALDLRHAPPTLFLFGLAGSGKSFVGNLIGAHAGWHVYHADDDLTDEMRQALAEHRPFTGPMRDRFFAIVVERIRALQREHPRLVVTQAVYKRQHRDYLLAQKLPADRIYVGAPKAGNPPEPWTPRAELSLQTR